MAEELKPNVAESKYAPLNLEEFQQLKTHLEGIKSFLPEHLMGPFWSWCNRIRGEKINQPCSCKSSGGLWADCVDTLRKFVRERSE
jgi:hypothetical protein